MNLGVFIRCSCERCRKQRLARARAGAERLEQAISLAHALARQDGRTEVAVGDLQRASALMRDEGQA